MKVLSLFSGIGGGLLGFLQAGFESVGAFDNEASAIEDLEYLCRPYQPGLKGTVADLATLEPHELAAACTDRPDVVFTSPPCKSFSGCLPTAKSKTARYRALSSLAQRGIWLALEAWKTPPPLILMENVPRIQSRGKDWLDQTTKMLHAYGYVVHMSTHDCGELGGLAQRRRRFLLVARHREQVPEWLYQPPKKRVRGVGEVLGQLPIPLPGEPAFGPMHRLPKMSPLNWLRLALIPAGGDWRDLPERVEVQCSPRNGVYGVQGWSDAAGTVVGNSRHDNGRWSIADPRSVCKRREGSIGVTGWSQACATVIGHGAVQNGPWQVADVRVNAGPHRHHGGLGVIGFETPSGTVVAHADPRQKRAAVADPRVGNVQNRHAGKYGVEDWANPAHTVIGEARTGKSWAATADPRLPHSTTRHTNKYGLESWDAPAHTVIGANDPTVARSAICDPRLPHRASRQNGGCGVAGWDQAAKAVVGHSQVRCAPVSVVDPRLNLGPNAHHSLYGMIDPQKPAKTVVAHSQPRSAQSSVVDPRLAYQPRPGTRGVSGWSEVAGTVIGDCRSEKGANVADPRLIVFNDEPIDLETKQATWMIIVAADGTWHRPLTTLELAALQGFPTEVGGQPLQLSGKSHKAWRMRIGNAVPPPAAEAIARSCAATLKAAADGSFLMSAAPVWVEGDDRRTAL